MKKRWIASLALSLGLATASARAGDEAWHGVTSPPASPAAPAAQLGRPIAVDTAPASLPPLVDNQVRPTAYENLPLIPVPLVQAQATDVNMARPLPMGSPPASTTPTAIASSGPAVVSSQPSLPIKPIAVDDNALPAPRLQGPQDPPVYTGTVWGQFDPTTDMGCGDCATGSCPLACCPDGGCYNPGNRFYVSAEALLWWMKGNHVPPLVTTGSAADAVPGALGQPGTQVLYGNSNLASNLDAGGRFAAGYWFTEDHSCGIEGSFWFLGTKSNDYSASSLGNPLLFRPFTDETGAQNVELVAVPSPSGPGLAGTVSVQARTSYWGTDADFRSAICCGPNWHLDALAGVRVMGLDDDLDIHESLVYVVGATIPDRGLTVPAGTAFQVDDHFSTMNRFYGGQVGLDWEYKLGNWIFGAKGKLALGDTNEVVNITGATTISVPGAASNTYTGGLLAQSSNIGRYSRNVFSVVPEGTLQIGYQFNEHWRVFMGYNVIYWSNVVRSGDQIDLNVNRNQIPPPVGTGTTPAFAFHSTDFWAQGMNFGVEFKW